MNLTEMSDERIRLKAQRADTITELIIHEAAKGERGVKVDDLYPQLFLLVLSRMI